MSESENVKIVSNWKMSESELKKLEVSIANTQIHTKSQKKLYATDVDTLKGNSYSSILQYLPVLKDSAFFTFKDYDIF